MIQEGVSDSEIGEALRKLVRDRVAAGSYVVLNGDRSRNYFVQFATQQGTLFCEAVHNKYLARRDRLGRDQERRLTALGWRRPRPGPRNWHQRFEPRRRRDYRAVVRLARRTLRDVYGLTDGEPPTMECSWDGQVLSHFTKIRFASEGHRSAWDLVASTCGELFKRILLDTHRPVILVSVRSLAINIAVRPVAIHSSLVDIVCTLATGVPPSPELMHWLLLQNRELRFGLLSLSKEGDVGLSYSLVGDTVTPDELRVVLGEFVPRALWLRRVFSRKPRRSKQATGEARAS